MQRMPTTRIESKTKIVEAKPEGDIRYDFEIAGLELVGDSTLPAETLSAMKTSFEPLRGLTGRGVATQRGLVREVKLDPPPGSDPQLVQILSSVERAMRQMVSPFPEEAIGVGAGWKHSTTMEEQGVTLSQTATYTLVSLEGDQGKVTFTIEQAAPMQSLKGAGLPDGMGVLSLTGKGSGETQFDLKRLTPTRASLELASQGDVSVNGQIVTTKTQTSMMMEGK
jgi:hypothetical protein